MRMDGKSAGCLLVLALAVAVAPRAGQKAPEAAQPAPEAAQPAPAVGGAVPQGPAAFTLTDGTNDDDFPACAVRDGAAWCAYVSYRSGNPINMEQVARGKFDSLITTGNGDQVRLIKFDGRQWTTPLDVSEPGLDVWRPAVAIDGRGLVRVIWSQKTGGDWELHTRSYDAKAGRWSATERLTNHPGADINVVAATARSGHVWIAWQSWEKTDFAIRARSLDSPGAALVRNFAGANEWNPAIAADSKGKVYVAFDTYAAGNYDAYLWVLDDARPSMAGETVPVATSARFEADAAIAVDKQDRVWVAYEQAGPNWGKDYGAFWDGKSGVALYIERTIGVRRFAGGRLQQTVGEVQSEPINTTLGTPSDPPRPRQRLSMPRLAVDDAGRPWLMFRRHAARTGAGERWVSFATRYDGKAWSAEERLPSSENMLENRPAILPWKDNRLLAVYSGDGRTRGTATAGKNKLYAALLGGEGPRLEPALIDAAAPGEGQAGQPVHPAEAEDIRRIRSYRATAAGKTYQLMRGEFHRHTEISSHRDQDGTLEDFWRYALDAARMDWIGNADHDTGEGREYTWWLTQKQEDMYHHPPVFLPMFSYERSVVYPSGHRNVVFARRGIRPLPRLGKEPDLLFGSAQAGSPDIKNLYAYLKYFGGICSPHTSATNMGTDWRDNDPAVEPVVEIYQGRRLNYEEANAPRAAKDVQQRLPGYRASGETVEAAGYVWNALAKGYRLGFQSSSDHISTHISYAVVFAENPTRAGVLDALKRRHSYAANDNIILDVRCGGNMMGDEFTLASPPRLDVTVIGTAPVARLDVVRQTGSAAPAYVYAAQPGGREVKLSWTDSAAAAGAVNMYYVRITQEDGKIAWASPMWIHYQPASR